MDTGLVQIILALIAIIAVGVVVRIAIKKRKDTTTTEQHGNIVGGDQAGRDIKKDNK